MTEPRSYDTMTGDDFHRMLTRGLDLLRANSDHVNTLNVYPVPDGDTGTNMTSTLQTAVDRISDTGAPLGDMAGEVSVGSLMGARGNSGVILSQLLRGFAAGVEGSNSVGPLRFARALQSGVKAAYSAVMRPVEGTILTVARKAAEVAEDSALAGNDLENVLTAAIAEAERTLQRTPEMLDVLREAGVIDAGGQGLVYILEGALAGLTQAAEPITPVRDAAISVEHPGAGAEVLEYPYDIVLLLQSAGDDTGEGRGQALEPFGDSLIIIDEGGMIKVHIHTDDPVSVLNVCSEWGTLVDCEIKNMDFQTASASVGFNRRNNESFVIIPMAAGDGLRDKFLKMGASQVVEGGPTMNPSTENILEAVERESDSVAVILLPNNPNLVLACEQVTKLSEKTVYVVKTRNIPQGMAATCKAFSFDEGTRAKDVVRGMEASIAGVRSLEVTYAVDDRNFSGVALSRGDIIGFIDGQMEVVGTDPLEVLLELVEEAGVEGDAELSVFYGSTINEPVIEELERELDELRPGWSIEIAAGGQKHYHFIASLR